MLQNNQIFRKTSLERLSSPEQLDQLMMITNPKGWFALVGVFCLLAVLVFWCIFGLITIKVDANGIITNDQDASANKLQAVLYLPFEKGQQVTPGMLVQLTPDRVQPGKKGKFLVGKVLSVSQYPVTEEQMLNRLGNKGLLKLFNQQGLMCEVVVGLPFNDKSSGQYTWSGTGAENYVTAGDICSASIIIKQQKPIYLLLPLQS
ncbi:MAG: hypothetical protein ACM3MK_14020 [Chitinophagales bacterium]